MDFFTLTIFVITIIIDIFILGGLIFTIIKPKYRIWPPPDRKSWQFWVSWMFTVVSYLGPILLSILDWDTFILSHWLRFPIGLSIIIIGFLLAIWSVGILSIHSTLGLKGKLITRGPYKYSRNPQYLADIIIFAGLIILANSYLTLITGVLVILWNFIIPFTEEPWLKQQFKEEYEIYRKKVRRFI